MPPRFHPRDFMVEPDRFGEDPDARWKRGTTLEGTARIAAVYAQHHAAIEVREKLCELGRSAQWLAQQLGQNAPMVRRELDGDYPALPEDVVAWAIALDDIMAIYAPGNVGDLLPPVRRGRHAGLPGHDAD